MRVCTSPTCPANGQPQPLENFGFRDGGTRRARCRACTRAANNASRRSRDTTREKARVHARKAQVAKENSARLHALAVVSPCHGCGQLLPDVLEWDHLDPTTKTAAVTRLVASGYSWARVEAELAKCVPMCASCHLRRTRRGTTRPGWRWALLQAADAAGQDLTTYATTLLTPSERGRVVTELEKAPATTLTLRTRAALLDAGRHDPRARQTFTTTLGRARAAVAARLTVAVALSVSACVDCFTTDLEVLTFDHVHAPRDRYIADLLDSAGTVRLVAELAKCVVRCANCHMRITRVRAGSGRSYLTAGQRPTAPPPPPRSDQPLAPNHVVRAWAHANGIAVAARGNVPTALKIAHAQAIASAHPGP